jgi:O-antigen ligase
MAVEGRRYTLPRREGGGPAIRHALSESPALPAQALAVVGLLYLAATEGGYYVTDWYPIGLGVLALLAIWAALVPLGRPPTPAVPVAVVLFVVFAGWAILSISWADEPAAAWDGANRALLYAALFALFSLWPVGAREARWLIALIGFGIALLGLVELLRFAGAADPSGYVLDNRLAEPVGYQNGNVGLWLMGAFCCLWLAAAREPAPVVRGLALGAVSLLASLALLGQSRGSLFALPIGLALFVAVAPGGLRLRLLAAMALAGAGVALAAGSVLDVVDADNATLRAAVDSAARAIMLPSALLTLIGAGAALADRRFHPTPATARRISRGAVGLVGLLALLAAAAAAANAGQLRGELADRWDEFKSNDATASGSARLGSGGTNRYDFWTVAWDNFEGAPLKGVGIDNFQQDYLARGETKEKPRFPHSLELALLSETGLVGTALFLAAIAAAIAAALRARRAASAAAAGAAAAALGAFSYWAAHASVDWLYELPSLGGLAFVMLGLACGVRDGPQGDRVRAPAARAAPALLALAAAASFSLPWLAEREVLRASETWREAPAAAIQRLDRAAGLNPTSARPDLFKGTIALRLSQPTRAERAFLEVVEREPRNAYAWLQLAALASQRRDHALARRRIGRAFALNPKDEPTRMTRKVLHKGARVTPQDVLRNVLKYSRRGTE